MQTLIDQLNLKALKVAYYGKSIRKTKTTRDQGCSSP